MATEQRSKTLFRSLTKQVASDFWRVICAFYVFWWGVKHSVASFVHVLSKFVLLIAASFLVLDVVLLTLGHEAVVKLLDGSVRWVLLVAAILVFLHRWKEWLTKREGLTFVKGMEPLFDSLGQVAFETGDEKRQAVVDFVRRLLVIVHETFKEKLLTNVNIMLPAFDGTLIIRYKYPSETEYDPSFCPEPGDGGAGLSFAETTIVYIPAVRYRHGITMKLPEYRGDDIRSVKPPDFGFRPDIYVAVSKKKYEVYSSILSIPITGPNGTIGVLNLDSKHRDGFDDHDAHVANAYARAMGVAFSLCPDALS